MKTLNVAGQALLDRHLAGEKIPIVPLLFMDLTVPQRWAICGTPLVWDSYTWAARDIVLGDVSADAGEPSGLQITLPGVTEAERALAFDDTEGAAVVLYLALVDPDTAEVGDALEIWAGELDMPGWSAGAEQAMVHFSAEHRSTIAMRQRPLRYTDSDQQRLYSGDTSLDFDPATDAAAVVWPNASFFRV